MQRFVDRRRAYFQACTLPEGRFALLRPDTTSTSVPHIRLSDNDYLAIGHEFDKSEMKEQPHAAAAVSESEIVMSAVFLTENSLQHHVTQKLARSVNMPHVALCQSGYVANLSLLQCIVPDTSTIIYMDAYAHESLWQGCRHATRHRFRHNDVHHLSNLIRQHGPGVIVVDSLYSSRGTIAPLQELVRLCSEHGCVLVVDESHSIGVYGPEGKGLVAALHLSNQVDFIVASLAKAFCCRAGIIATHDPYDLQYIREHCSHTIFSSALMRYDLRRILWTTQRIQHADAERHRLREISIRVRDALRQYNFVEGHARLLSSCNHPPQTTLSHHVEQQHKTDFSPIITLIVHSESALKRLQHFVESHGIEGAMFIAPATPIDRPLLRLTLHAGLADTHVDQIINCLRSIHSEYTVHQQSSITSTFHDWQPLFRSDTTVLKSKL